MWPPLNVVHLHICSSLETHFSSAFILSEEVRKRTESAPPPPEQNHAPSLLLDVSIARPWTSFIFYLLPFSVQRSVELVLAAKLPPLPDTSYAMSRVPRPACPLTSSANQPLFQLAEPRLAGRQHRHPRHQGHPRGLAAPGTRGLVDIWTVVLLGEDF